MRYFPIFRTIVVTSLAFLPIVRAAGAPKPNIIFILVDDMGWGDLGVFYQNSRNFAVNRDSPAFTTPCLDAMAEGGIQLRRHYTPAPVCVAARASLLAGVTQGHSGVRDNQFDKAIEDNHTIGTVLKQAGYATALIGKYGLGGSGLPAPARPQLRGFDYFFGFLNHGDAHDHYPEETGSRVYDGTTNITADLAKCYSTDLFAARAKKWIVDQRGGNPGQPFFLYLALTAPHAKLDVPTQAYPEGNGLTGGLQWLGTPGGMINTANGTTNSWIHPDYADATYDHDSDPATPEIAWPAYARRHATMMRRLDRAVGDLNQTLRDLNIFEDTLVVFTSDNGPHNEAGSGGSYTYNPTFFDSFGPLDGIKRDTWEGGMREPALARWPGHIPAGSITAAASQFQDWLPTFAELAGVPAPARADGVSLVPTLTDSGNQRPGTVYVEYLNAGSTPVYPEFEGSHRGATRNEEQVIHLDGYKGIRYNVTSASDDFRIYDVVNDRKETTDLAGTSAWFAGLQQRMKDRVLQLRRAGGGASRPYDNALVPPVVPPQVVNGLDYAAFEKATPWVPDWSLESPVATGHVISPDVSVRSRDNHIGLEFSGYLKIPTDGTYTFHLATDTGSFVRIHDAQLTDADFDYAGDTEKSSGAIPLKAGYHPIRIHYRHATASTHSLALQWSGPGFAKQPVPAGVYFHPGVPVPVPPAAYPDHASTTIGQPVSIAVLANDTDDGTPQALAITQVDTPVHGTAVISGSEIIYTPAPGFRGEDSFHYTISDGQDSSVSLVSVSVTRAVGGFLWVTVDEPDGDTALEAGGVPIGTLQNFSSTTRVAGPQGRALEFDGVDDVISIHPLYAPPVGSAPRTISAWLKPVMSQPELAAWLSYGVNTNGNRFSMRIDGGRLRLEVQGGYIVGTTVLSDGNWHHVAAVVSDANNNGSTDVAETKLYVDGKLEAVSTSGARVINTTGGAALLIGGSGHNVGYNYAGGIDDVRIYPAVLSAAEISSLASRKGVEDAWYYFHTGNASPSRVDWLADADGDGLGARLEFALGGDPATPDSSIAPFVGEDFHFVFNRRKLGIRPEVYVAETSGDLQEWSELIANPVVEDHPTLEDFERIKLPLPASPEGKGYFRLRVDP